jgi:hypothetical protein
MLLPNFASSVPLRLVLFAILQLVYFVAFAAFVAFVIMHYLDDFATYPLACF